MRFDMAGIHHQPLKVCVIHQRFQNPFPNSLISPSAKPSVYILPVSIGFWQVPPRRSGAQNPEYSVDKLPGVSSIPASFPFSPIVYGSIFSQPLSLIPCRRYSFPIFQPSYFFEDYFIIFLLTIPSRPCLKNKYCTNKELVQYLFFKQGLPTLAKIVLSCLPTMLSPAPE